ncbi:MAG: GPR endopeptidase [Candidatus Caccosoma sp.]|nr:GPR endopeptidase [Candidatus Caccosoma sp.]
MTSHSDFADELVKSSNKSYKKQDKDFKSIKISIVDILKEKNEFNKEKGKYISLSFDNLYDDKIRKDISEALISSLKELYKLKNNDKVLIVGLGNSKIIADSLGPLVADKIIVTNHLFKLFPKSVDNNLKKVCVFTPKVMGQTGLESSDLIQSITNLFKPNLVILIDALASSSIKRINKVIQLSNTGIAPGSGVGNYRKEISEKTLNTKVVAIGVATVVHANQIIKELANGIKLPDDESYNLILTPKEIDEEIEHLALIIATSINKYIHKNFNSF